MSENWEECLNEQDWHQDWDDLFPKSAPARVLDATEIAEERNRIDYNTALKVKDDILFRAHWSRMGKSEVSALVNAELRNGYSWEIEKIAALWPENYTDLPLYEWSESLLIGTERVDALELEGFSKKDAVFVLLEAAHMEKFGRELVEFGFKRIYGTKLGPGAQVIVDTWPEVYGED